MKSRIFLLLMLPLLGYAQSGRIHIDDHSGLPVFTITVDTAGLLKDGRLVKDSCSGKLAIYVKHEHKIAAFPVNGSYQLKNDRMQFTPFVKPDPSLAYVISCHGHYFPYQPASVEPKDREPPRPAILYPHSQQVPVNVLCFYLAFDQEMRQDLNAHRYVEIWEEGGKLLQNVWRQKSYWIKGGRVLVLMIHPGRVKRGIHATSELGPVFETGRQYKLILREGLVGLTGIPVSDTVSYLLNISARDEELPSFQLFGKHMPVPGSRQTLQVIFTESMDYGLVVKWLKIRNNKKEIPGSWETRDARHWQFVPDEPWESGKYQLVLPNKLSDPAHNQMDRKFEEASIDPFRPDSSQHVSFCLTGD